MKKILFLITIITCSYVINAQPGLNIENPSIAGRAILPPVNFMDSTTLPVAVDSVVTLQRACVAAELRAGVSDGYIEIHPVKSPAGQWYKMPLTAGQRNVCLFDQIRLNKATGKVNYSEITVFPVQY